jgi:two-component system, NtrC family, response regulator HupR/HoxA
MSTPCVSALCHLIQQATARLTESPRFDQAGIVALSDSLQTFLEQLRIKGLLSVNPDKLAASGTTQQGAKELDDAAALAPFPNEPLESIAPLLIGQSKELSSIRKQLPVIAQSDAPVLILGENGTGKEGIATALVELSNRHAMPFLKVNCGAVQDTLLESELFGHVKGAFTGAMASREGYFARAHGGTLLLDELGDMSAPMQVKLLRVLQEGTFMPVGGTKEMRVNVRVIAATNKNLRAMVAAKTFREDLFYRLNVVPIQLPPLRERKGDISLLAHTLLRRAMEKRGKEEPKRFTRRVIAAFTHYPWPGNVRELENIVTRMLIFSGSERVLDTALLPTECHGAPENHAVPSLKLEEGIESLVHAFEAQILQEALTRCGHNMTAAAKLLKLSQPGLKKKMDRVGVNALP